MKKNILIALMVLAVAVSVSAAPKGKPLPIVDESGFMAKVYSELYQGMADEGFDVPGFRARDGRRPHLGSAEVSATTFLPTVKAGGESMYNCFPTCAENDGRFLSIAGTGLETLVGFENIFRIAVDRNAASFELGIFDGDTGGLWDFPRSKSPSQLEFRLYADPAGDGSGVGTPLWTASGGDMTDNTWFNVTLPTDMSSQAPSGHYFYVLHITLPGAENQRVWTNFKLRSTGVLSVHPELFAYSAFLNGMEEAPILYPNWPDLRVSTYDGTWNFHVDVPHAFDELVVWDGDFDFGSHDGQALDVDDWVTGTGTIPPFAVGTQAVGQGVAIGCNPTQVGIGCPADDSASAVFRRSPSIRYDVCTPGLAQCFPNDNPSGNREWQMFRIASSGPAHHIADLAQAGAGVYHVRLEGVDLTNLNALKFEHNLVVCQDELGNPCIPLRPELQGCTPGYWRQKQHMYNWTTHAPSDRFDVVFGVPYRVTLFEAVTAGGGGERALGRHAVAALLNATNYTVAYKYTAAEVITMVQQAWGTKDVEKVKNILEAENEVGCPL